MKKTTNKKCKVLVNEREAFKASNLSGFWLGDWYIVQSYGWYPLYLYNVHTNRWYENSDRYSVSTSKQLGQARPDTETIKVSHEDLKKMLNNYQTC